MLVHTPFRKSWECDMRTRIRLNLKDETEVMRPTDRLHRRQQLDGMRSYDLSSSSSHTQASRSKWFVGSSSNNMKGLIKRALIEKTTTVINKCRLGCS